VTDLDDPNPIPISQRVENWIARKYRLDLTKFVSRPEHQPSTPTKCREGFIPHLKGELIPDEEGEDLEELQPLFALREPRAATKSTEASSASATSGSHS
jgi:hypothetical protein